MIIMSIYVASLRTITLYYAATIYYGHYLSHATETPDTAER